MMPPISLSSSLLPVEADVVSAAAAIWLAGVKPDKAGLPCRAGDLNRIQLSGGGT